MRIGFVGLGVMGQPMALNLRRAGTPLVVWNRTPGRCEPLAAAGASIASSVAEVFDQAETVLVMLATEAAVDTVLGRGTAIFAQLARGHTIVHMGTTSAGYSAGLAEQIAGAGGSYVESPVSGSRVPAEQAALVAMLAGVPEAVDRVRPVLAPMCHQTVVVGPVPQAMLMKFATNAFLITQVTGLAEAVHFARRQGLDLEVLRGVLDAGQMASGISRVKLPKLINEEFGVQAAIADVLKNNRLVVEAARDAAARTPLLDACLELYTRAQELGLGPADMAAVIRAL
jgi:3-hydroxyisobutyrate dehydrogenase